MIKIKKIVKDILTKIYNLLAKIIKPQTDLRIQIATHYLGGSGIEIGALHYPLKTPANVQVSYVDRMNVNELRLQYPEFEHLDLVNVDIIDDGEILKSVSDSSVDFVIANHLIEHSQNPIGTLKHYLRVIKTNGILFMAIPDKRHTFDSDRPVTSLEHLIKDYNEGAENSKVSHFEEWVKLVEKAPENQIVERMQHLMKVDHSIHFHVWTQWEFLELLLYCKHKLLFCFEIELMQINGIEFIVVLRKTA